MTHPKQTPLEQLTTLIGQGTTAARAVATDLCADHGLPLPPRPLRVIAREIRRDWLAVHYAAVPYLEALATLDTIGDAYGADDARGIVRYFLSNAKTWKGDTAKRIKAELQALLATKGAR